MNDERRPVIAGLRVTWQEFRAPRRDGDGAGGGEVGFGLWVPDDPNALLDEMTQEEFDRSDERMPYFGTIWPSAESLVAEVLAGPRLDGKSVLDLGCGLGACGFAAAQRGGHVAFFDWEPRALEIVAASAQTQGLPASTFDLIVGDWRDPLPFGLFDLILGADVLYERRNAPTVAAFLARHLRPGAEAWITDQGRPQAQEFPTRAQVEGLAVVDSEILPPQPHGLDIALLRLRRLR
jgi:SAM-dependent methyltransferase